jgi:hypothetical protein
LNEVVNKCKAATIPKTLILNIQKQILLDFVRKPASAVAQTQRPAFPFLRDFQYEFVVHLIYQG